MLSTHKDILCSINSPEQLTNETIQALGAVYLKNHSRASSNALLRFFDAKAHTNHLAARKLRSFSVESSSYEKWRFLADCYQHLEKSHGELSRAILQLFSDVFKDSIDTVILLQSTSSSCLSTTLLSPAVVSVTLKAMVDGYYMEEFKKMAAQHSSQVQYVDADIALSNEELIKIAQDYLSQYPETVKSDSSHLAAKFILDKATFLTNFQSWMVLADAYALLKASKGEFSKSILRVFAQHFGASARADFIAGLQVEKEAEKFAPKTISRALKLVVRECYQHKYKKFSDDAAELLAELIKERDMRASGISIKC